MRRARTVNRIVSVFVLTCFTFATLGSPVLADGTVPNGEKITLRSKIFGGYKFKKGDAWEQSVFEFSGMSFKPEFENTLATYPPALAEAKQAFVFNGISTLCYVGILAISISDLLGTIDNSKNLSTYNETEISWAPLIGLSLGAAVTGILGKSKVQSGVKMYNENAGSMVAASTTTNITGSAVSTSDAPVATSSIASSSRSASLGIKAGLNMAKQDYPNPMFEGVTKFAGGFFMNVPMSDNLSIQAEALYSMKGSKIEDPTGSMKYSLDYLDVPVLFKYTFPTSGSMKPFLMAGPTLSFLMRAKASIEVPGVIDESGDIKELYKSTDVGLAFGGGVQLGNNMHIDGRYTLGMSNIASNLWAQQAPGIDVDIKNSAVTFMLGFSF